MPRRRTALAAVAGTAALFAASAQAADAKTMRLFSHAIPGVGGLYGPDGKLLGDQEPTVGSYFIGADDDFAGTHAKHAKRAKGWDHVRCTVLAPSTFTVRCNVVLALKGGLIISDEQTVSFAAPTQKFKITAGTGAYRKAKGGTVTATSIKGTDDSDVVIRY
jgi:hypothetical protein